MRIHRHDAQVNVIYKALSQDHPGVVKEQRASQDSGSRPGEVFHPGMVAVTGVVVKDEKDLADVEKIGSDFIPLVVEILGFAHNLP